MVLPTGVVMCPRCKVTITTTKDWNAFMEPVDIAALIDTLERPLYVLKAIAVYTKDSGLKGLAATTIKSLKELEFNDFFADPKEAETHAKRLEELVE